MPHASNPRAVEGSNSARIDESKLTDLLRQVSAPYNMAANRKRDAAGTMRDIKRNVAQTQAEVFEAIESIRKSAVEKMQSKLRERQDYVEAENEKSDAAADMRAVLKSAKEAGIDVPALKVALKLADMDSVERKDHFDNIDIYAKCLRLWGPDDL